jgi:hypothetical protein
MIGAAHGQRENLAAYNEEYAKFFPDQQTSPDHGGST